MRWSKAEVNAWYDGQPWLVGCTFIPSTAVNQLEMWQEDSFDVDTIARELRWAAGLGFNTVRVYLHDMVWQEDAQGFKNRIDRFLDLAAEHDIRVLFVLFDDCFNGDPKLGRQPEPERGRVHPRGDVGALRLHAQESLARFRHLPQRRCRLVGRRRVVGLDGPFRRQ